MRAVRRWLLLSALVVSACHRGSDSGGAAPSASTNAPPVPVRIREMIYDGQFENEWAETAGVRDATHPGPASLALVPGKFWVVTKRPHVAYGSASLAFRVRASQADAAPLEVHLQFGETTRFPSVRPSPKMLSDAGDGWTQVLIPFSELNPNQAPFDTIFLGSRATTTAPTVVDQVGLTEPKGIARVIDTAVQGSMAFLQADCRADAKPISPLVYGIAFYAITNKEDTQWKLNATGRRWGGNTTTRYNWELGNAWNTANDWFFENVETTPYTQFLDENDAHGFQTALTVPMIGWVAKDTTSFSFPVSEFGPAQKTDQYRPGAGNGMGKDGKPIKPGPPTRTSVQSTPEFVARWVRAIRERDAKQGHRSVDVYMLDNETAVWSFIHRDVHPEPVTYDELLERTLAYGAAVRAADPQARIAGPAAWGWNELFFSAKDSAIGQMLRPDRRAHGDVPLLPWYLKRLHDEEQRTGTHILDLVDVHYYPQAEHMYGDDGAIDPKSAALRIRSTRSLWDYTYTDESYVNDKIYLLPRLHKWIDENFPGRGIVIGEWNFGAEAHMSGGLATAEALGRFGQNDVTAAYYWNVPKADTPSFYAFRAFRNFDGKGGHFLEYSLPTVAADSTSLFASRDASGKHLVAVALNLSPDETAAAEIALAGCAPIATRTAYVYSQASKTGFVAESPVVTEGRRIRQTLPPYSITVLDVTLSQPMTSITPR
ncbi:MAG TPA: glycoside hydrolase family 44 protein [Polyangiaceae bacterium]|jgi:hypothetical protein|nr:glycoside hydrolase family 44 protein [Polyangiaceae bacterium]